MYTLAHPWLLSLILLPLILRLVLPPYREPKRAIRAPWFDRFAALLDQARRYRDLSLETTS